MWDDLSIFHDAQRRYSSLPRYHCNKFQYLTGLRYIHRYTREIPEPAPFLSWHGTQIGGIRVFPTIKTTAICQVRMYCSRSVKINTCEMPHGVQRSWTRFVWVCFHVCGLHKPEDSSLSPMADNAITRGGIWGLGSPLYICGYMRPVLTKWAINKAPGNYRRNGSLNISKINRKQRNFSRK